MLKKVLFPFLCGLLAMDVLSTAQAVELREGKHYTQLAEPVLDAPEVVEFFSFYCPPCYAFAGRYGVTRETEKVLPVGARIVKYHVSMMGPLGKELTDAWSVARILGVESQVELPLFRAVQEKRSINSKADIRQVFIDAGVPAEQYDMATNSLVTRATTATQVQAAEKFGVTGTPSLFVKGKYLVRNNGMDATTEDEYGQAFADVVSELLKK
ncbi:DsbA family protein [Salmonella enterica]|nr:thioredoxin domain-containing protein [Salmonella enterica subsp. enterica]EKY7109928.1 DsbA family protein [Salmonella enterica]